MTFLEMVQDVWRQSGSGGQMPTTVLNQSGERDRLVSFVRDADAEIQSKWQDWSYLWSQTSFETQAGISIYAAPSPFVEIDKKSCRLDDSIIDVVTYASVKDQIKSSSQGRPHQLVLMPDGSFRLDSTPAAVHTVSYDYFEVPTLLVNDADVSLIPVRFHKAIIGRALIMLGTYEAAQDVVQQGAQVLGEWLPKLEADQLPGDRHMHTVAEGNEWVMTGE